jgi:hypothetical protein
MKYGKWFVSTGFHPSRDGGWWHLLIAAHRQLRFDFVRPAMKPGYSRLYIGFIEIEWSHL